jgi:hypothetical protein
LNFERCAGLLSQLSTKAFGGPQRLSSSRNIVKIQQSLTRLRGLGVEDIFARVTPAKELARQVAQKDRIAMVRAPYVEVSTRYGYVHGWMRFHDVLRDSMSSRVQGDR